MRYFKRYILSCLCLFLFGASCRTAEPGDWDDPSWQLLREAHIHRDAHSLAVYLREQCGADADLARIDALIRQLGSPDFEEREKASKSLVAVGPAALSRLRAASGDPDAEVSRRAKDCIARIGDRRPELTLAAVRVLIRRGGDEAVPALVRLLPYADFEELQDDLWFGLDALTVRQGKIDPSLTEALHDPMAIRRAAAACIVGRRGDAGQRDAVRKLLTDADAEVRLRAAQGLLAAKDASGMPALAALLEGTPMETAWQAEELLRYVAGEEAPHTILGAGAADDRRAYREAWEAWWKERGPKVDLAKLDATSRRPGLMLLCDGGLPEEATGRVWLLGCDGVTRWELRKLSYPVDARLMPGGRVLVAERSLEPRVQIPLAPPSRKRSPEEGVSMRDLEGKVLWRYRSVSDPTQCQPMPDGHIVVTGRKLEIAELDKTGNELFRKDFSAITFPHNIPMTRLREFEPFEVQSVTRVLLRQLNANSHLVGWLEVETNASSAYELIRTRSPAWASYSLLRPDGLVGMAAAGDGVLVETKYFSRVECYDNKIHGWLFPWIWKQWMPGAYHAAKLPNGRVLAGGIGRVVEFDAEGQAVWSSSFEDQARQVRPCLNRLRLGFDAPRAALNLTANPADWLQGLQSKNAAVRRLTAEAIREFALRVVEAAAPSLTPLLMDPDEAVRDAARRTLGRLSSDVPPEWLKGLKDQDPQVRRYAWEHLNEPYSPSKKVEALIGLLKDDNPKIRWEAANDLGTEDDPYAEKVVAALIATLTDDKDAKVRRMAADSVGRVAVKTRAAVPMLLSGLKDPNIGMRATCAYILCAMDPVDERVIPTLIAALQDNPMNWYAVEGLSYCGPRAKEAVPVLVKMLEAKDFKVAPTTIKDLRKSILQTLGRIGPDAKAAVPPIAAILRDRSAERSLRQAAARALGEIGPAAKAAIPDLKGIENEEDFGRYAAEALVKIQED